MGAGGLSLLISLLLSSRVANDRTTENNYAQHNTQTKTAGKTVTRGYST